MGTGTNLKTLFFLTTMLSTSVIPLSYEVNDNYMTPTMEASYSFEQSTNFDYTPFTDNMESLAHASDSYHLKVVLDFSKELIENLKDIDPEFNKIVNDNFLDLLA